MCLDSSEDDEGEGQDGGQDVEDQVGGHCTHTHTPDHQKNGRKII